VTTVQQPPTAVDAVAQLDTAAQRAGLDAVARIVRAGGPTAIQFASRADYEAWADYGLIAVDPNPYGITVGAREVHVPVMFGHPVTWRATAVYPTQDACACEVVHPLGCPGDLADAPECPSCGVLGGSHQESCYAASRVDVAALDAIDVVIVDLPRRTPGAALAAEPPPDDADDEIAFVLADREREVHYGDVLSKDPDLDAGRGDAEIARIGVPVDLTRGGAV
jgi:hypothetical protein